MSAIVLLVALFFTTLLTDMPKAVLGAIVFLIGIDLIDITGLRRIARRRWSEFVIAVVTGVVVCAVGMEQGIILAIAPSIIEIILRWLILDAAGLDDIDYSAGPADRQPRPTRRARVREGEHAGHLVSDDVLVGQNS
jgi:MFS superfamily sulfate permease-like transporter